MSEHTRNPACGDCGRRWAARASAERRRFTYGKFIGLLRLDIDSLARGAVIDRAPCELSNRYYLNIIVTIVRLCYIYRTSVAVRHSARASPASLVRVRGLTLASIELGIGD